MTRECVKCGLRAYKHMDNMIESKRTFAQHAPSSAEGERYLRQAEQLSVAKGQIIEALNRLETMQMDVLWRKYIRGEYWVQIGMKHNYSERQIIRIGEIGLDCLAVIMEQYPEAARFCRSQEK